jgi:hypothetical protein
MRGGLFGRSPAARATIARRLGVSVRRVLRLERSGIAVLRRAGSCNKPAAGSAGDVPHGTFMPAGGAVSLTSGSTGASDRGRNKDVSGVLGAEMSHSAPLRASSSEADARSRTLLALLAFLVVLSALVLAAGIATRRSGVPPALLAKRFRRSLKPLLFMDVDGVLALWPLDVPADPPGRPLDVGGVRVYLCERGAEFLRELATRFEIVWATGWEDHANRLLGDVLELEEDLPTLRFGDRPAWGESEWKIPAVSHASGRRPAAWVDDSIGAGHRRWARRRGAPTLLVNVDSSEGLCEWHVRELIKWADEVDGGTGTPTAKNRAPTPA